MGSCNIIYVLNYYNELDLFIINKKKIEKFILYKCILQFSCAIFPYKDMCTDKKLNFSDHGYLVQGQIRALNSPYNNKGCPNIEKSMYVHKEEIHFLSPELLLLNVLQYDF